jgi:predicted dehydrogenase
VKEIRIGLAGLGKRGLHWLKLLRRISGYRVVAVCDPIEALRHRALADIGAEKGGVDVYERYEDLIADDGVDAIALCVRCREQGALAAQALEAGKHVSAEVPCAHTMEDCWRLAMAVERSGCIYQLGEQTRYWGFVEKWRDAVADGRVGTVTFCEGQYFGFYGTEMYFQDPKTGAFCAVENLADNPGAEPNWMHRMPPIHYLPHELSPMLKVLDDRVVEVVAMGSARPSASFPQINQSDVQVALMKTEKGAVLRMAAGFSQPVPQKRGHHWYQVMGTRGCLEWNRSARERPKFWYADADMDDVADADWTFKRDDAPASAEGSGHGDADYYVHTAFRDAVLEGRPLEFDIYDALDTAAPAILAAESIERGSVALQVPDFRPSVRRRAGENPPENF